MVCHRHYDIVGSEADIGQDSVSRDVLDDQTAVRGPAEREAYVARGHAIDTEVVDL